MNVERKLQQPHPFFLFDNMGFVGMGWGGWPGWDGWMTVCILVARGLERVSAIFVMLVRDLSIKQCMNKVWRRDHGSLIVRDGRVPALLRLPVFARADPTYVVKSSLL